MSFSFRMFAAVPDVAARRPEHKAYHSALGGELVTCGGTLHKVTTNAGIIK
jgi:hypothetical protein